MAHKCSYMMLNLNPVVRATVSEGHCIMGGDHNDYSLESGLHRQQADLNLENTRQITPDYSLADRNDQSDESNLENTFESNVSSECDVVIEGLEKARSQDLGTRGRGRRSTKNDSWKQNTLFKIWKRDTPRIVAELPSSPLNNVTDSELLSKADDYSPDKSLVVTLKIEPSRLKCLLELSSTTKIDSPEEQAINDGSGTSSSSNSTAYWIDEDDDFSGMPQRVISTIPVSTEVPRSLFHRVGDPIEPSNDTNISSATPASSSSSSSKIPHSFFQKRSNIPLSQKQTLASSGAISDSKGLRANLSIPGRSAHPFFDKVKKVSDSPYSSSSEAENSSTTINNKAGELAKVCDTSFRSNRGLPSAIWPSLTDRHVKYPDKTFNDQLSIWQKKKSSFTLRVRRDKYKVINIPPAENVMLRSVRDCSDMVPSPQRVNPQRLLFTTPDLQRLAIKNVDISRHDYLQYLYHDCLHRPTAFDVGDYESQMWSSKYAPIAASQINVVDDSALIVKKWLLATVDKANRKKKSQLLKSRRLQKRPRKSTDSLDSFICYSDDETEVDNDPISSSEEDYSERLTNDHEDSSCESPVEELAVTIVRHRRLRKRKSAEPPLDTRSDQRTSRLRPRLERPCRNSNFLILCGPPASGKTAAVYAAATELGYYVFEIHAGLRRSGKNILDQVGEMSQSHLVHSNHQQNASQGFKQKSLLLIEDVDTVFEEDKAFWLTLFRLIETSKRPIILTCTDASFIPHQLLQSNQSNLIRFQRSTSNVAVDMLWLTALCEGHLLRKSDVTKLFESVKGDLRSALAHLQFWCQMAVGDDLKGLNWVLIKNSEDPRINRVISEHTFDQSFLPLCFDMQVNTAPDSALPQSENNDETEGSKLSKLKALDSILDARSCADIWRSNSHSVYNVHFMPDFEEPFTEIVTQKDVIIGCPTTNLEPHSVRDPLDFEFNPGTDNVISTLSKIMLNSCNITDRI
ncbi:hypothetical protein V1511DRAFT_503880 [Dipodascopsis uninucleata]